MIDSDKVIRRLDWQILGSLLCQFLELGQAAHGSFAKSESDQDFLLIALEGILLHIADIINRFEVPRLFRLNAGAFRLDKNPTLVPADISVPNLESIADPLAKLITAGAVQSGPALEEWLRQLGKIPPEEEGATATGKSRWWPFARRAKKAMSADDALAAVGTAPAALHHTLEDILGVDDGDGGEA
jgi:hypothetical protein